MKFSCNQQNLAKALNIVSKAVTARTTIPILKGILLKVNSDGTLTMSASDLDLGIEKTFKVENLFIPFGSGATRIMRDMLAEYSMSYPDQTLGERLYVIDKLWTIVMGKAPKENEQKAIKAAIMLDEWLFFAMQGYWELQYACSDYYEAQKWNLDCFYPIIVLVIALALYDGRYVRDMCEAAEHYLNPNDEDHVKAVRMLRKWRDKYKVHTT